MNKPEANKLYALTGGTGEPCIANGNTWAESEVKPKKKVVVNKKDKLISMKIYKPKVKKKTAFQIAFENAKGV
tara:strand:+ start:104 stop:322 length:219 start_codon:yes stop_codon:yes gene_type:complete